MNFTGLLGSLQINSHTNFDYHLLILILPFLVFVAVFLNYKKLANLSYSNKNTLYTTIGICLITAFGFVYVEEMKMHIYRDGIFGTPMNVMSNIDVVLSLVLGLAIFTRRFYLARALVPASIVLATIKLINNPGATITTVEMISAILLISFAFIFIAINNRKIPIHAFGLIAAINVALLTYVLVVSKNTSISNYAFSINSLENNFFYEMTSSDVSRVILFITWTLVAQTIIFGCLRQVFLFKNTRKLNLLKSFIIELKATNNSIKKVKNNSNLKTYDIEVFFDEILSIELEQEENYELEQTTKKHHDFIKKIFPFFIHKTIINKDVRAPTF